jgi:predicted enzyme related to lactoylglutathione lyase
VPSRRVLAQQIHDVQTPHMSAYLAHIAINSDDDAATRRFWEQVFDLTFTDWGPPGFARAPLQPGREAVAAVQSRRALIPGVRTTGPEVTLGVDDVELVLRRVIDHGGRIVMERTTIPTVGDLAFVTDPSENIVGVIQYSRDNAV